MTNSGPETSYVGIDLAWSSRNPSGVAVLEPVNGVLRPRACELAGDDAAIIAWLERHLAPRAVIMVDAPLRVPNQTGMRPCDRETHRRYGRYHAGAYPANRRTVGRYNRGDVRGEVLVAGLARLDVRQATLSEAGRGRTIFECYPHPAQVMLFKLDRVLKYKKKRQSWAEARSELARFAGLLAGLRNPDLVIPPELAAALQPGSTRGREYKSREDRLDALFCAYLAALAPTGRLEMLGSLEEGHIVVPR